MNSEEQIPMPDDSLQTVDADSTGSVDDFIRELEAKEKDLHITSDLQIEIEDSEFEMSVPEFVAQDLKPSMSADGRASSAPINPVTKARNFELESEVAQLKVRVMELKAERNDIQEKSDRRVKDFESFKYRMDRERRSAFIDQIGNLAVQMLPVLDNLDRALDAVDEIGGERSPEFQQFFDGIVLVNQQLNEIFAGMGVQPISTIGETFDPNFHEAVATGVCDDMPPNTVCEEMLRGYRIGNKVIRHSMVKVAVAPAPPTSAEEPVKPTHTPVSEELSTDAE